MKPHASAQTILTLVLLALFGRPAFAQTPVLSTDFSLPQSVSSASGLLVGASLSEPPLPSIQPLKPALWRFTDPNLTSRLQSTGANLQIVVSDSFCYPELRWCGKAPPYANWATFEQGIKQMAQSAAGQTEMFDIWNEPDNPMFWDGTQAQFFEAYLRAYRVIRQTLGPSVLIGGPSIAQYDKTYLTAFLNYCLAQGCEVNFLSWHELDDSDTGISSIAGHLQDARSTLLENPLYAKLNIQKIYVNESIGALHTHRPGGILGYLYQLEKGGADGAARACWADSTGANECYNNTLDGLVTPGDYQPRSAWWVYSMYAGTAAGRVYSTTSNFRVVPIANAGSASAQVLIGYFNQAANWYGTPAPTPVVVQLQGLNTLPFLAGLRSVRIVTDRIPDTEEGTLARPLKVSDVTTATDGTHTSLLIPSLAAGDAIRITLLPPEE